MYAVVVTVESDATREDEVAQLARAAVGRTKAREGFVLGLWLRSRDSDGGRRGGRSVLVFDTEEHADAFAAGAGQGPPAGAPVTLRSVEVFEVIDEVERITEL